MTKKFYRLICFFLLLGCGLVLPGSPVLAKVYCGPTQPTPHHHVTHKSHSRTHAASKSQMVMDAQQHLINLGYLTDRADGVLGPKTRLAVQHFQRDQGLKVTGKLTRETVNALIASDLKQKPQTALPAMPALPPAPPPTAFYDKNPDFYGHYDQQYADAMAPSPANAGNNFTGIRTQTLATRFGKIDVSESNKGDSRSYTVTVDGKPLLQSDDQPNVIGISQTYTLGNEDAILFTTYRNLDPVCTYKHYLLAVNANGNKVQEIANCTRGYQATAKDGSLFITFPEYDDQRAVGNTWRYENGNLTRL